MRLKVSFSGVFGKLYDVFNCEIAKGGLASLFEHIVKPLYYGIVVIEKGLVRGPAMVVELILEYGDFNLVERFGGLVLVVLKGLAFFGWNRGNEMQLA